MAKGYYYTVIFSVRYLFNSDGGLTRHFERIAFLISQADYAAISVEFCILNGMAEDVQAFKIIAEIEFPALEQKLRATTLLNQPDVHPYEDARITIERFGWNDVLSTSKFVEEDLLGLQLAIRESISPHGFDQLELHHGLVIDNGSGAVGLIPPIVEQFGGDTATPYVLDGAHRAYLGYTNRERYPSFLGILITHIRPDCPPYAFPNGWDDMKRVTRRPLDKSAWKNYRNFYDRYKLYRDYSHIIMSAPRGLDGR